MRQDGVHEKWVCATCAQGGNPWTQNQQMQSQDDIEGAFSKQILQHLAAKHGIDFMNAFKERIYLSRH